MVRGPQFEKRCCRLYCVKRVCTELETDSMQYCCNHLRNTTVIHAVQTAANAWNVQLTSVYRDKTNIFFVSVAYLCFEREFLIAEKELIILIDGHVWSPCGQCPTSGNRCI